MINTVQVLLKNLRRLSGQTDEGVDLTEVSKCPYTPADDQSKCQFYVDCICNSDLTLDSGTSTSGSLNSGSEFEEFAPVKGNIRVMKI